MEIMKVTMLYAVWGKITLSIQIYDNISGGGGDDPKRPSETVENDNDIEPITAKVVVFTYRQ